MRMPPRTSRQLFSKKTRRIHRQLEGGSGSWADKEHIQVAATADKEHIQARMSNVHELLAVVKKQQVHIKDLTKQIQDLIDVLKNGKSNATQPKRTPLKNRNQNKDADEDEENKQSRSLRSRAFVACSG